VVIKITIFERTQKITDKVVNALTKNPSTKITSGAIKVVLVITTSTKVIISNIKTPEEVCKCGKEVDPVIANPLLAKTNSTKKKGNIIEVASTVNHNVPLHTRTITSSRGIRMREIQETEENLGSPESLESKTHSLVPPRKTESSIPSQTTESSNPSQTTESSNPSQTTDLSSNLSQTANSSKSL